MTKILKCQRNYGKHCNGKNLQAASFCCQSFYQAANKDFRQQMCCLLPLISNRDHCLKSVFIFLLTLVFCYPFQGFFRRCITQGMTHKCSNEEKCEITPFTRNSCQYCRLKKCIAVGMSREGESSLC